MAAPTAARSTTIGARNLVLDDFLRNKRAMGGCAVVLLLVLFCFVGPLIYRTNQTTVNLGLANTAAGARATRSAPTNTGSTCSAG